MEKKQIKGIIARDNTNWQTEFENAVKDSGCGVMWKDQISDFWEIKDSLLRLISQQGYFDFYNIAINFSNYHCKIVDFATTDDYPEKMMEWRKRNPAWFCESFDEYSVDKQKAFIAFLVEDFKSIPEKNRIHINYFITYNKKQAWIKNAVAYTDIITEEQLNRQIMNTKIMELLTSNKNLILTGAPGTGKTYLAQQIARELGCTADRVGFVQFHPSYDYTDFVEGIRPVQEGSKDVGFKPKDGIFKKFCAKALTAYLNADNEADVPKFVFIIDEINRGDISKIFGELFFSIDPGYRVTKDMLDNQKSGKALLMTVKTQYANMQEKCPNAFDEALGIDDVNDCGHFFVPENVYIIGTMNDIDRSVESMDFAFRRRFAFKEIKTNENIGMLDGMENKEKIINRMNNLNREIEKIEGLSPAYHIGGSYFMKLKDYQYDYDALWNNHILGLLWEYLRNQPEAKDNIAILRRAYDKDYAENKQE